MENILECDEELPPTEYLLHEINKLDFVDFDNYLPLELFLGIMEIKEIPQFIYEENVVLFKGWKTYIDYQNIIRGMQYYVCRDCAEKQARANNHGVMERTMQSYYYNAEDCLTNFVQVPENWCTLCYRTPLFIILEWHDNKDHLQDLFHIRTYILESDSE